LGGRRNHGGSVARVAFYNCQPRFIPKNLNKQLVEAAAKIHLSLAEMTKFDAGPETCSRHLIGKQHINGATVRWVSSY
jgi:hypothetical protein